MPYKVQRNQSAVARLQLLTSFPILSISSRSPIIGKNTILLVWTQTQENVLRTKWFARVYRWASVNIYGKIRLSVMENLRLTAFLFKLTYGNVVFDKTRMSFEKWSVVSATSMHHYLKNHRYFFEKTNHFIIKTDFLRFHCGITALEIKHKNAVSESGMKMINRDSAVGSH